MEYTRPTYLDEFENKNQETPEVIDLTEKPAKPKQKKLDKSIFGKCKICNDKATGMHYGVATCEGCKVILRI